MEQLVIKYPVKYLLAFTLGALLALVTLVLNTWDIWTGVSKISYHFYLTLIITVVNVGLSIREGRKYAHPIIIDKEGILYGKERYFWSSIASCRLERVEENKLVLSFKETYAKPVSIDLNNYQYHKWDLVRVLQHFPSSPLFQYED